MARIVILTGAGISAESGIGTFRDKGGIWATVDVNDVATPEGFARNPQVVYDFYNMRRATVAKAEPNAAHLALARLTRARDALIITQNVDDLHEKAGARDVIHMHGEHRQALCAGCSARWPAPARMSGQDLCPSCGAASVRPDVVWFGETPYHMDRIAESLSDVKLFAAIGTSGQVYPAAGLVRSARAQGATCVELNLEQTDVSGWFDAVHLGPASVVVPDWVDSLLSSDI